MCIFGHLRIGFSRPLGTHVRGNSLPSALLSFIFRVAQGMSQSPPISAPLPRVVVVAAPTASALSGLTAGQSGLRAWLAARLALIVLFCCGIGFSVQRLMFKKLMVEQVSSPFQVVASRGFVAVCVSGTWWGFFCLASISPSDISQSVTMSSVANDAMPPNMCASQEPSSLYRFRLVVCAAQ